MGVPVRGEGEPQERRHGAQIVAKRLLFLFFILSSLFFLFYSLKSQKSRFILFTFEDINGSSVFILHHPILSELLTIESIITAVCVCGSSVMVYVSDISLV